MDTQAIEEKLIELPDWNYESKCLCKEYQFKTYLDSIDFVKVGLKAETIDHHPRIIIDYKKIRIELITHSAGDVTSVDFKLAKMIESLYHQI